MKCLWNLTQSISKRKRCIDKKVIIPMMFRINRILNLKEKFHTGNMKGDCDRVDQSIDHENTEPN